MNWNISRNYDERVKLFDRARKMEQQRDTEVKALADELTDEDWNKAVEEIHKRLDTLPIYQKIMALEYPKTRNKWFTDYAKSFGICEGRRITRRQGEMFARYGEPSHERESGRGTSCYVRVENLFIRCILFSAREPAYITIREID